MDTDADDRPLAVVGVVASAGGVEALSGFVGTLRPDFPAAVLVVLHVSESGPSVLPHVLTRRCALPVAHAADGEALRRGAVFVAPPGHHLRVRGDVASLDSGPRENRHRPSADALLRSIADTWGNRAAGVVLSGTMDDGAAGLRAVRAAGGFTMVQDPAEATFPGMPRAAIGEASPAVICPLDEMGTHLLEWMAPFTSSPAPRHAAGDDPPGDPNPTQGRQTPSALTCPDCGGTLWEDATHGVLRFRCRVGHTYSLEGLLEGKQGALEAALWAAVVALRERADVLSRVVTRLERVGLPSRVARTRIESTARQVDALEVLLSRLATEGAEPDDELEEHVARAIDEERGRR